MKVSGRLAAGLFVFTLILSCNQNKHAALKKEFRNGKVVVEIIGNREGLLTPFTTTLNVKAFSFEKGGLKFEFFADDINDTNVRFEWLDDETCNIYFTDKEGSVRKFQLKANPRMLQLGEVSE